MVNSLSKTKKAKLLDKKFITLLIVGILGWVVYLLGDVIDNIYSGQFFDEAALSAVQVVIPYYSFINFISILFSRGFGVRFSNLMGNGNKEKAYKVAFLCLSSSLLIGIIIGILMIVLKPQLIGVYNLTDPQVIAYANSYYDWYIGVAFACPIYTALYQLATQDGDAFWTVGADIAQVVSNALISLLLIKFTNLGIAGLSLGTFIATCFAAMIVIVHFFTKNNSVKFKACGSFKELGCCLRLSLGSALGTLFVAIVDIVMNKFIVSQYGDLYLSSYTIVNFILNFIALFTCAAESAGPFLASAYGAKNNSDFKHMVKLELKWGVIVTLLTSVILCSLCLVIPKLFGINEAVQYHYSYIAILILGPTFIFSDIIYTICLTYVNEDRVIPIIILELLCDLIFPILLPIVFSLVSFNISGDKSFSYYFFIAGFGATPILSFAIVSVFLLITNKSHKLIEFPVVNEEQFSFDCFVTKEGVREFFINCKKKFEELHINKKTQTFIGGCFEDCFILLKKYNPNKIVTLHSTFCISDTTIRILNQNDSRTFSDEERKKELENKENHFYLNVFDKIATIKFNKLVSFNYSNFTVERSKFN